MDSKELHKLAFEAMKKAVEKVNQKHKDLNIPVVIWEDNKVVYKYVE